MIFPCYHLKSSSRPPNPRPAESGTGNKMTNFVNRNQKPFKVSNSMRDRRLNPDKIKIPGNCAQLLSYSLPLPYYMFVIMGVTF